MSQQMTRAVQSPTIAVNDAAALVPLGPRRFRQLADLETPTGKVAMGLVYVDGRAHVNREAGLKIIKKLQQDRRHRADLPQKNLDHFATPNRIDPVTKTRICIEHGCEDWVSGRGKLCAEHSQERAERRRLKRLRRAR